MQSESTPDSPRGRRSGGKRGNNEGAIYQVKTGRQAGMWRGAVTLADGKRKYVSGETREEASRKVTKLLVQLQGGRPVNTDNRVTLGAFLRLWLEHARRTTRPRTYASYEGHVRLYLAPALGTRKLIEVTPIDVEVMLVGLTQGKGLSPATARHALVTLRIALNQALKWGHLAHNPAALADPPKQRRVPIAPLSVEQARALLNAAEAARPGGHRLSPLLTVALTTGLRAGEILALRWEDVDLQRGRLTVRHALEPIPRKDRRTATDEAGWRLVEPKSTTSRRTLPLLPLARAALAGQRTRVVEARLAAGPRWQAQGGGGFVFPSGVGTPIGYRNMVREYSELLAVAGLPPKRFHDLRHTCASFLLASGADLRTIMAVLGHSQISLTANTYAHVLPAVLDEAAAKLEALFTGQPPVTGRR